MNKTLLVTILFLVLGLGAKAQARPGIKVGLNNSNIGNTTLDNKNGIYIGAFIDIRFTDYYTLQPEVLYSGQGGRSNSIDYGDVNIDYISIGVPNKFYVGPNKGFHFVIGPSIDINVENTPVSLTNGSNDFEISPLDISFFGGIGYEFGFGLILEARYKQGTFSTDFFGETDLYEEDGSQLNTVLQVGLAYKFKIR